MISEIGGEFTGETIDDILSQAELISQGEDAVVFAYNRWVLKRYGRLDIGQIRDYQEATRRVGEQIGNRVVQTPLGEWVMQVNPIIRVVESSDNFDVVAISELVKGRNVQEMFLAGEFDQQVFNLIEALLNNLSLEAVRETEFTGVHMIPWNVTLVEQQGKTVAIVTDVCRRVNNLRRKSA